jgi:hypothetical protein
MNDEQLTPADGAARQRKGRLMMLAIVAVFVAPFFILPLLMSPATMSKTNKGTLIDPPVTFASLQIAGLDHHRLELPPLKKWALMYIWPTACEGDCVEARNHALLALRQASAALGRDSDRVQSLVLLTTEPSAELSILLQKDFKALVPLLVTQDAVDHAFAQALPGKACEAGNIYLMSPDGYIFIYYAPEADEKRSLVRADDLLSDLKKSLKGSRI